MPSPTKSHSHTTRLLAQIAELSAQRDQLITQVLPLIPADVLAPAEQNSNASTSSPDVNAESAAIIAAKSDMETSPFTYLAARTATTTSDASSITSPAGAKSSPDTAESATLSESTRAAVLAHADHTVKQHISRLHAYNGIRDIGQNVMGLLAEQRGIRVVQVMEECGVGEGD